MPTRRMSWSSTSAPRAFGYLMEGPGARFADPSWGEYRRRGLGALRPFSSPRKMKKAGAHDTAALRPGLGVYRPRSAAATGRRAARTAGGTPPIRPIRSAKMIPWASSAGVIRKAKARWEKVCQLIVPVVNPFIGSTARHPKRPPRPGDEQRFGDERDHDRSAAETEGPHGGDLPGPLGDGRVHRVQGAEHRADAHDQGDQETQDPDEHGHRPGLLS